MSVIEQAPFQGDETLQPPQHNAVISHGSAFQLVSDLHYIQDQYDRDVDAGEYDRTLEAAQEWRYAQLDVYRDSVGLRNVPDSLFYASIENSDQNHFEFGSALSRLDTVLEGDEREKTYRTLNHLIAQKHGHVSQLFREYGTYADGFQDASEAAYSESITSLIYTLESLKRGDKLPQTLPLRGGKSVRIGKSTFDEALSTMTQLAEAIDIIGIAHNAVRSFGVGVEVSRVNKTGRYGMYRVQSSNEFHPGQVLVTVRAMPATSHDPAIEYGNKEGTQASIGYSVDMGKEYASPYKDEQVDPFSIRVDNEGDTLALDIGSIFGKPGTLGKRIADLIAIGDYLRSKELGKDIGLNHNARPYKDTGLEETQRFAQLAAGIVGVYEKRIMKQDEPARRSAPKKTAAS